MSMRLDQYLEQKGLASSRSRAKALILAGAVSVNGRPTVKPSFSVEEGDTVLLSEDLSYVSRGGNKLEAALSAFSVDPCGCVVLDVGASSGGFTDCVLQNGAARVFAVDVGRGQLVPALAADSRVTSIENFNARYMTPADFDEIPSLAVMDVSFISQTLILPALSRVLPVGGELISLIKPQFEAGRGAIGRGGIVREEKDRRAAVERVRAAAEECGLVFLGVIPSPIRGGDGNMEYLAHFQKRTEDIKDEDIFPISE